MAAFDLVILLALLARLAAALERQAVVVNINADLLARQTGELGGEYERLARFAQVHGGRPSLRSMGRKAFEAVLNADQIAERVPAREHHDSSNVAWPSRLP